MSSLLCQRGRQCSSNVLTDKPTFCSEVAIIDTVTVAIVMISL